MTLIPKLFPRQARNETDSRIEVFKSSNNGVLYYKDRYGNLVPIFQGDGSIYVQDGTLTGDRVLTGASNFLHFDGLSNFTVETISNINLNPGGEVAVENLKSISFDNPTGAVTALKVRSSVSTYISFENATVGAIPTKVRLSGVDGLELYNNSGVTTIENNLAYYSGTGNSIANITADLNPKVIPSREWVNNAISLVPSIYNSNGALQGNRSVAGAGRTLIFGPGGGSLEAFTVDTTGATPGVGKEILLKGDTLPINLESTSAINLTSTNGGINIESTNIEAQIVGVNTDILLSNTTSGNIYIGSAGVGTDLVQIRRPFKYTGSTPGIGYLLQSDAAGNATWQTQAIAAPSIYQGSGTIPTTTVATVTDTVNFNGGKVGINVAPGVYDFQVAGTNGASVSKLNINSAYSFPTSVLPADAGKALTYDGAANLQFKPIFYDADGTVGTGRVATITDDLTWTGGRIKRIANSINIVEVTQASDLPATLIANTTYVIRGTITTATAITVSSGNAVIGLNRTLDNIVYTGAGDLFTVTDQDFSIRNLGLKATNATGKVLDATNITADIADNNGRTKVLELQNLLISGSTNVWTIRGFELVDVGNCLFWYTHGGTIGCQFQSCRHLEISSCEFYNWYELGTPANIDLYRLIEILPNFSSVANGVVNINSSIIHPETIQYGLWVPTDANPLLTSTTGFGTISSNTFTDTNLTTGRLVLFDYDAQNTYIVQANQGVTNGNAFATMNLAGNLVYLDNSVTNPIVLKDASTVGGGGFTSPIAFPFSQRTINVVADGSIEYNRTLTSNFIVIVTATVQQAGNGVITARLRNNGTPITSSVGTTEIKSGIADTLSFSVLGQAVLGNVFDIEIESSGGSDVLVSNLTLNGYNF